MSSIGLATRFNIGRYLLNRKSVTYAFLRSADIIKVFNELPTDKKNIKVPHDRVLCHTHVDKKKKQVFQIFVFKCVT